MGDFAETAAQQYGRISAFFRRRTNDPYRAEELTQEVFAGAARALQGREAVGYPLEALLFTIAQRRFVDYVRDARRAPDLVPLDEARAEPVVDVYPTSIARSLKAAIARLSREQRQVVVWKLLEGRSFAEIAKRSDASEAACRMRFRRALAGLRQELETEGIER